VLENLNGFDSFIEVPDVISELFISQRLAKSERFVDLGRRLHIYLHRTDAANAVM
jgi:hypothetical protein